jgi:transcriptional regulator with XRE-family HTH domain
MDLSARLDLAMRNAGYTSQSALARAAAVSQSAVNRILKRVGTKGPDTATIAKLAKACGVSPEYLISGIEDRSGRAAMQEEVSLVYVTATELHLLTRFRESTLAGQNLILDLAENTPKQPELPPPPADDE